MKLKPLGLALFAGGVVASSPLWAVSPPTPEMVSYTCNGCHGTDGSSAGLSNPTIAGLTVDYFDKAMKDFKNGTRPSTIMQRLAKGYTDEDFKTMAIFFAAKPFARVKQAVDPAKVALGRELHEKRCETCHAKEGYDNDEGVSVLAGQWKHYLEVTMDEYRSGKRAMPKKMAQKVMVEGTPKLTDAEVDALLHFYASQP